MKRILDVAEQRRGDREECRGQDFDWGWTSASESNVWLGGDVVASIVSPLKIQLSKTLQLLHLYSVISCKDTSMGGPRKELSESESGAALGKFQVNCVLLSSDIPPKSEIQLDFSPESV